MIYNMSETYAQLMAASIPGECAKLWCLYPGQAWDMPRTLTTDTNIHY